MAREKITIISGKIKSGKTTYLINSFANDKNVCGLFQPQSDNERFFQDIETATTKKITLNNMTKNSFRIGKFIFDGAVFDWAKEILRNISREPKRTIVIDEYGPLEFNNSGLEPEVSEIIKKNKLSEKTNLVIVVRESLLDDFIKKFNLKESDFIVFVKD